MIVFRSSIPCAKTADQVDGGRVIRVSFDGSVSDTMPWKFRPTQSDVRVSSESSRGTVAEALSLFREPKRFKIETIVCATGVVGLQYHFSPWLSAEELHVILKNDL